MKLLPAIKSEGKLIVGDERDSHSSLALRKRIKAPDKMRGFTPDGQIFLTRKQALGWLKAHDIKTFRKLPSKAHYDGLHSEHLAKARGIEQREEVEELRLTNDISLSEGIKGASKRVNLKDKTVLVYDRGGLHTYIAEKLSERFGKTLYFLTDSDAYPTSQKQAIGHGIPGIKRVHDFWKHIESADLIVFPDCYDGELQHFLRSKGYIVFGSGRSEKVEIDKIFFLETLEELGLPVPLTYLAEGMDDLKDYLKKHDGETLYLKNLYRGDFESRKFSSLAQSKPFLDDLVKRVGTAADTMEVLIQHKIDSACEAGIDSYCIDGKYPKRCLIGYESKDIAFGGKVLEEAPEILQQVNDAFAPVMKKLGGRCNYSTEIRITEDGSPYYIDATCRQPSPPGEVMCEVYKNWADMIWGMAHGDVIEPEPKASYVAEIILTSSWYDKHELHVKFPEKYASHIKLKNHTMRDGEHYCIPNGNGEFFGAVVAWGDTLDEAIEKVKKIAESIEADEYKFDPACFDSIKESIKAGKKFGINI